MGVGDAVASSEAAAVACVRLLLCSANNREAAGLRVLGRALQSTCCWAPMEPAVVEATVATTAAASSCLAPYLSGATSGAPNSREAPFWPACDSVVRDASATAKVALANLEREDATALASALPAPTPPSSRAADWRVCCLPGEERRGPALAPLLTPASARRSAPPMEAAAGPRPPTSVAS